MPFRDPVLPLRVANSDSADQAQLAAAEGAFVATGGHTYGTSGEKLRRRLQHFRLANLSSSAARLIAFYFRFLFHKSERLIQGYRAAEVHSGLDNFLPFTLQLGITDNRCARNGSSWCGREPAPEKQGQTATSQHSGFSARLLPGTLGICAA